MTPLLRMAEPVIGQRGIGRQQVVAVDLSGGNSTAEYPMFLAAFRFRLGFRCRRRGSAAGPAAIGSFVRRAGGPPALSLCPGLSWS